MTYVPIQTGPDGQPVYVPPPVEIPADVAQRFLTAVEGLFTSDRDWSVLDLDGAREFYEAARMVPDPDAIATE